MRNLEDARAIARLVDVLASERCNVAEIAAYLHVQPRVVRDAMWLGPSVRRVRRPRAMTNRSKPQ